MKLENKFLSGFQVGIITVELRTGSNLMMEFNKNNWSVIVRCKGLPEIWLSADLIQNGLQKETLST